VNSLRLAYLYYKIIFQAICIINSYIIQEKEREIKVNCKRVSFYRNVQKMQILDY